MPTPEALQQRRLAREISARQQAESLLEQKSLEIYVERQERQAALQKLQESEERYRLIVELSPDAIMVQMDGKLAFANPAARRMFAENNQRQLIGSTLNDLGLESDVASATEDPSERIETIVTRLDGSRFEIALRCLPMTFDGKAAMQVVARDISDRKRLEKEIAHYAAHDALTGGSGRRKTPPASGAARKYPEMASSVSWRNLTGVCSSIGRMVSRKSARVPSSGSMA